MSVITITTPFNIDLEFRLATLNKRFFAWFIDVAIICTYYYLVLFASVKLHIGSYGLSTVLEMFLITFPVLLYQLACEIFLNGQTLGKRLIGIKIIDREGNQPTIGQYILRWILNLGNIVIYIVPQYILAQPFVVFLLIIFYLPDSIAILATKRNQRLGDLAAGTVVIDARYKSNINTTIYQQIEVKAYVPMFPQVMQLTDRDINGIRNLMENKRNSTEGRAYVDRIVRKIKEVLQIQTEMGHEDFLRQLLYDYSFLTSKA
jgi:uncharacterized RDD family membrane protein YckC